MTRGAQKKRGSRASSTARTTARGGEDPIPLSSTRQAGLASEVLAFIKTRFPLEATPAFIAREIRRNRRDVGKALVRLGKRGLAVRGSSRGAWRAWADAGDVSRLARAAPALHAIQLALPSLRLRGGLSPSRHPLREGRSLHLQDGLVSVHATLSPVPVAEWGAFLEELRDALAFFDVVLDESAQLVSFELNADSEAWSLRGVQSIKLQDAPGFWAQIYRKKLDERTVTRAEVRATSAGLSLSASGDAFAGMRDLDLLEAVGFARALVAKGASG